MRLAVVQPKIAWPECQDFAAKGPQPAPPSAAYFDSSVDPHGWRYYPAIRDSWRQTHVELGVRSPIVDPWPSYLRPDATGIGSVENATGPDCLHDCLPGLPFLGMRWLYNSLVPAP